MQHICRHQQNGATLLSLMIGLLISMIAILGMMSLFNTAVKNTTQSSRDARITGERTSGLLVANMHLQSAGYGLTNTNRTEHLLLLSSATLNDKRISGTTVSSDGVGNALVWQNKPGAQSQCTGLYAPNGDNEKGLYELTAKNCTSITEAVAGNWEVRRLIFDKKDIQNPLALTIHLTTHDAASPCKGFGIAGAGSISITLNAQEASGQQLDSTTCLLNFPAASI